MTADAKLSKEQREHAARVSAIAARGDVRPPSSDIAAIIAAAGKPQEKLKPTIVDKVLVPAQVLIAPSDLEKAAGGRRRMRRVNVANPGEAHPPAAESPVVPPPAAAKSASTPPPPAATPPEPEAVAPALPWAGLSDKFNYPFPLRLSDELNRKLDILANLMPGRMSKQKLIIAATVPYVDELLANYYHPPADQKEVAKA